MNIDPVEMEKFSDSGALFPRGALVTRSVSGPPFHAHRLCDLYTSFHSLLHSAEFKLLRNFQITQFVADIDLTNA